MIRVCPERDAACPHGAKCPWVGDRYTCKPGWRTTPQERAAALNPKGAA